MTYDERVRRYEAEGMTRSDAQGIVDLEDMRAAKKGGTMSTHTPGPWEVSYSTNFPDQQTIQAVGSDRILALVDCNDSQDNANALLFAAAPAMLEALIQVQAVLGDLVRAGGASIDEIEAYSAVKEAIRLAEGRA